MAGLHDREGNFSLDLSLEIHSWRVRARNLFQGLEKPTVQQIQNLLKEVHLLSRGVYLLK